MSILLSFLPLWLEIALLATAAAWVAGLFFAPGGTDPSGKRALVTGGGSGIGRQVCVKLAAAGARVIVWDLNEAAAQETAAMITGAGGWARAYKVNVADKAEVAAAAQRCVADAGGEVDILHNNAGIVTGKPLLEASDAAIERTMAVNALAPMWVLRAFLPAMLRRNSGHIVTTASASAYLGVPRLADYAASKWAVFGMHESVRMELRRAKSAIKTTIVCPFFVKTGMFEGAKTRLPWFLPILEVDDVSTAIVSAIKTGRQIVNMPPLAVNLVPFVRAVSPAWVFDWVADQLGVTDSMDDFVGRRGATATDQAHAAAAAHGPAAAADAATAATTAGGGTKVISTTVADSSGLKQRRVAAAEASGAVPPPGGGGSHAAMGRA